MYQTYIPRPRSLCGYKDRINDFKKYYNVGVHSWVVQIDYLIVVKEINRPIHYIHALNAGVDGNHR